MKSLTASQTSFSKASVSLKHYSKYAFWSDPVIPWTKPAIMSAISDVLRVKIPQFALAPRDGGRGRAILAIVEASLAAP